MNLLAGMSASTYIEKAAKEEERHELKAAIENAKSMLVKLEGAFLLSWTDEVRTY